MNWRSVLFCKSERRIGLSAGLWIALYMIARAALESRDLPTTWRVAIAVAPLVPFVWFLREFIAGMRETDELERRIQLEALAIAFPLTLLMIMTLGLVQVAVPLNMDDWSYRHIWPFVYVFYLLGLVVARRRYQ